MTTAAVALPRRDALRGVASFFGLAALVAGVPWLLSGLGWPLPTSLPNLSQVGDALADRFVPEDVLVKGLAVACWVLWFELTASVLVEAVAVARRRQAPNVPFAGPVQRVAARLVAGVALLLALAATRQAAEERPLPPVPMVANAVTPAQQVVAEAAPAADLPVHEVAPRDTLWGIAEGRLGDPFRWREIYDLNRERPQPDGDRLRQPDLIRPGWRLLLPQDAAGPAVVPARAGDGPETMVDETPLNVLASGEAMTDVTPGPAVQRAGW